MSARFLLLCLCAWVVGFTMPVHASPTQVNLEPGASYWISNVADKCNGSNMSGLTVQLTYEYGEVTYTDTLQWRKKGLQWGVFEVNTDVNKKGKTIISLVKGGNTSSGSWTLKAAKGVTLEEVRIDGFREILFSTLLLAIKRGHLVRKRKRRQDNILAPRGGGSCFYLRGFGEPARLKRCSR